MKKLLTLILTVALLLCLASCQEPAQKPETNTTPAQTTTESPAQTTAPDHTEHTGRWLSFEIGHSYQFTCGCPSAAEIEVHYDNDGDQICDVCDYEMPPKTCTQPFEWVGYEEGHVMHMLCDCCEAPDVIEPHEDKNGDLVCDLCNYIMPVPEHTEHTGRWGCGEEAHWYEYTCGCVNNDIAELHYDHNNDGLCDACGYELSAQTCTQPFEWVGYEEGHVMHMLCDCCEAPDVIEPHEDKNGDLVCDFCNYEMPARDSYSLTMNNPKWLYEELKPTYYVGEIVSVKIGIVTDTGFLFFVNGEEITDYKDDSGIYWEFTFPMPACDTIIHFKTYDGFLPDWNYAILMETYLRQNLDCPGVWVRHYYGEFASGAIVAMLDVFPYTDLLWQEKIGDTVIQYYDGNRITVLYENVFYTLTEAYENGYLTAEDIAAIAEMHNNP